MERKPCKKTVLPFFCHVMREFLSSFFFPLRISSPLPQIPLKLQAVEKHLARSGLVRFRPADPPQMQSAQRHFVGVRSAP